MNKITKICSLTLIFFFFPLFSPYYAEDTEKNAYQAAYNLLPEKEVNERIHFIHSAFKGGETGSRIWYWSFLGLYSAGTITQLSFYFAAPAIEPVDSLKREHFRQDMMAGTITTGLGVIFLSISPMTSMYARNVIDSMPENTLDDRVAKLKKAELLLAESSTWEEENHAPLIHVLNFGVNLSAGLIIWLAFDRTIIDGLITFLPGFAVGELQLFTQPTRAVSDWHRYQEKYVQKQAAYVPNNGDKNLWHLAIAPGGLMVVRQF